MKFSKIPKNRYKEMRSSVKEGQVLIVPMDNRLLEDDVHPYPAGGKRLPAWFRNAPKQGVRNCAGIQDYLNTGFIIPAWTDFSFRAMPEVGGWDLRIGRLPYAIEPFRSDPFGYESTGKCPMTDVREMTASPYPKLVNPFSFITAPGWSLMIFGILHEPNPDYDVVPAVVHTDYYHHMNVVLNPRRSEDFRITYGQPLAHVIPFKRSGDTKDVLFADESDYKYVASRGLGVGPAPLLNHDDKFESSGRFYRRMKRKIDGD